MSFNDVLEVVRNIALADSMTYWLVGTLTLIAFVLMRTMLPVKGLSFVFAPGLLWGGLTAVYAAHQLGFWISREKSVQIVAVATAGMIVALVVMMALVRLADAVTRIRRPVTNSVSSAPSRVRV